MTCGPNCDCTSTNTILSLFWTNDMASADSYGSDHSSESLVQKLKVAIAVGCVRSKPPGISGKDYAQQLCDKFHRDQLEWKEKYEKAETEILHLKQKLALKQGTVIEQMDVECDKTGSDVLFPTPPSSGSHGNQTVSMCHSTDKINNSLSRHTVFLHHVISLQTGSNLLTGKNIDLTARQTIESSLEIIKKHIGDKNISNKLQIQGIQQIDKLYMKCDDGLKEKVFASIKISAEKLIDRILSSEEYRTKDQARHTELLQELSKAKEINIPVMELLADNILKFSDHLRKVSREEEPRDPYYFCSMYHIINSLDKALQSVKRDALSVDFREKILSKLEASLLHVTDKFPLFAHAIWRITEQLNE